ncbi:RHS repeat-associated core domain-containing protein [Aliiroseovarius halocynthiae]|uniref:RHS repeat-associated core domain-containing protein n=1 Tax=Aliiroseovarius halocynthiae TaxID=985055 RepID=A0A545SLF4_9RHOB|nr:RHS repeat-associated core domain-containing protein [Aliiroseovarius halocynthiae]TQV65792.1 RHS repeat-associated core domain-containing protein [Aliiroseovarius halocynthiae]SMR83559.1 RHS repeat-associated core domain-containing protein [Aliiroseovarius halocynthiae]
MKRHILVRAHRSYRSPCVRDQQRGCVDVAGELFAIRRRPHHDRRSHPAAFPSLSRILQMRCRAAGQWFQSESGLHQNWMRDYDPTTGRYLQADPLGLVDGASVYGYALQNTFKYIDVMGLYTVRCRATNTGGVGYEKGDQYYEGARKICEYECTRTDTGQRATVRACAKDLAAGDVCYGVEYHQTYREVRGEYTPVNIPDGWPSGFNYDTDSFWDNNWNYDSDFVDAIKEEFGEQ